VGDEYIENLQQQIHFMELELKLLKQKQEEEEKSGGTAGLFLDEQTTQQHLLLLKDKHLKMRCELAKRVDELTKQKTDLLTKGTVLKQEQELIQKRIQDLNAIATEKNNQTDLQLRKLESELNNRSSEKTTLQHELENILASLDEQLKTNVLLKGQEQKDKENYNITILNTKRRIDQQLKLIEKLKKDEEAIIAEIVSPHPMYYFQ
jgi:hypothetical protein